jgi:transposase
MAYIRYKTFGKKEYAYKVTATYNPEIKRSVQKQEYLGVVIDKEQQVFRKTRKTGAPNPTINSKPTPKEIVLDYGDTHALETVMRGGTLYEGMQRVFGTLFQSVMCLIYYRIIVGSAMRYATNWYSGNIANQIYPDANLNSQRISELLFALSDEQLQRRFFESYLKNVPTSGGMAIDSTGLPNQIDFPLCEWGHHNGAIEKETRLILTVDIETKLPLYFRAVAGNINDVSTLETTIAEMQKQGLQTKITILDAGYCSESNILALYNAQISFLTRLPSGRKLYKELILQHSETLETKENIAIYHKRAMFIKCVEVDLYGEKGFAYIVCDPVRKGNETQKIMLNLEDDKDFNTINCGKMILISDKKMPVSEVVPLYYSRQIAERLFGIAKDDLNILPIRTHSEETFRGYMFLNFLTLAVCLNFKNAIGDKFTVEQVLSSMRNLKCKVWSDGSNTVLELNKIQKSIMAIIDSKPKQSGD